MALTLTTRNGRTSVPGSYPTPTIEQTVTNLAVRGTLVLLGEADAGPGYLDEADLRLNFFTPDDFPALRGKYRSGRIVDAAYAAIQPSQDPKLVGAPERILVVKTNRSTKASLPLLTVSGGAYATLADRSWGDFGNLVSVAVAEATAEVRPTTGSFTLLVPNNSTDISFRANGGASLALTLAAASLPATNVAAIDGLAGVAASGGADRGLLTVAGTLAVAAAGNVVTITRSVAWAVNPVVGDALYIPSGSAIEGAGNENRGSYVVTAVTSTTVTATKLLDAGGGAGSLTPPAAVAATAVAAVTDLQAFAPVTVTLEAADPIDGAGKALEVNELTTATGRLSDLAYQLNTTKVTWVSKASAPTLLTSATERSVTLSDAMQLDGVVEEFTCGGEVVMTLAYTGTTGTATISTTGLTTTVAGGAGTSLSLLFSRFVTIADLVAYLDAQPGYSATVLLPQYGSRPPQELDRVSAIGICTTTGNEPGRIKRDAQAFYDGVYDGRLLQLGTTTPVAATIAAPRPSGAAAGIPAVTTTTFLSGGTKAGTTEAQVTAAIAACEGLNMNFGCALFSRDADADIAAGETESSSTYTLANVATRVRKQAEALSTQFKRQHRQWFVGCSGSYVATQRPFAISQSTQGRLVVSFLNCYALSPTGGVVGYEPWYSAVLAAAMQLAAYSRGIVHREPAQSGFYHAYGDFDPGNRASVEDALRSGLIPASQGIPNATVAGSAGRWTWVSDQTAYVRDASFYYNSIQAIYALDQLMLFVSFGVEESVVGESQADVDANLVKQTVESYLAIARDQLRLITPDDEAPRGWVKVTVRQLGGTYEVKVDKVKLAGLVYFVPIEFVVSAVRRSA